MKHNKLILLAGITLGITLYTASCNTPNEKVIDEKTKVAESSADVIERGKYLVNSIGCNDCHSPKKMGPKGPELIAELLLSGYPADRPVPKFNEEKLTQGFSVFFPDLTAAAGPWGVSFASNITPDASGIGTWTEEQFKKAITEGKAKGVDGGRMLLPPMPWFNFANLTDEDVHSIYEYLKTVKPVKNVVPAPISPDKM